MHRRAFLAAAAYVLARARSSRAATPASADLVQHDLRLPGDPRLARRALLLVPAAVAAGTRLRVLVLLHGLGETGNELLGIHAWGERYGLVRAYERLSHPPLARTLTKQRYLTDDHLTELNHALEARPFRGLALVCPVTPRTSSAKALDRYADWIEHTLLPAVRGAAPVGEGRAFTGLDGCSLGGRVGLEVFLRKPALFGSFGGVQAALGAGAAGDYATRVAAALARAGTCPIHIETSTGDPFKRANVALSRQLDARSVANTLSVLPGPHDQPFLREIGTPEMLYWHDRMLGS